MPKEGDSGGSFCRSSYTNNNFRRVKCFENSNIVYDESGTVYCYDRTSRPMVRHKMASIGYEPQGKERWASSVWDRFRRPWHNDRRSDGRLNAYSPAAAPVAVRADWACFALLGLLLTVFLCFSVSFREAFPSQASP